MKTLQNHSTGFLIGAFVFNVAIGFLDPAKTPPGQLLEAGVLGILAWAIYTAIRNESK